MSEENKPSARDAARAALLGSASVSSGKVVEFGGIEVELRRATLLQQQRLSRLAKGKDGQDDIKMLVHTLIECTYLPGTKTKVFTVADEAALMDMDNSPGGPIAAFMKAAKALAGDEEAVEKNSETAPTDS